MLRRKTISTFGAVLTSLCALHCSGSDHPGALLPGGGASGGGTGGQGPGIGGAIGIPNSGGIGGDIFGGDAGSSGSSGSGGTGGTGGTPAIEGCGDGIVQSGEACDDGNNDSGDGCSATCAALETDFACPVPGESCLSTVECGDGEITGAELCDDGNTTAGDGCSADCTQVEPGWTCLIPGLRCQSATCGDDIVAGFEECDFSTATTGCTDCRIDAGYDCGTTSSGCVLTECGNGIVEHGEQCDDDNDQPFDGCFACRREPVCADGVCVSACGDGQRFEDEGCDDGNTRSGDGCSATCTVEQGYACTPQVGEPPPTLELPIIYRDFIGEGNSLRDTSQCYNPVTEVPSLAKPEPCFHIDFNGLTANGIANVVEPTLGQNGRPVYACPNPSSDPLVNCSQNPGHIAAGTGGSRPNFNGPAPFAEWYDSSSPNNIELLRSLVLDLDTDNTYVFDANGAFYPINGAGWVADGQESLAVPSGSCANNVSFTSETHFWFEYQGGELFEFRGDDDLWVFVNRKLAIDLGGLHGSLTGSFTLDADTDGDGPDTADGTAEVDSALGDISGLDLGLSVGGVYEIVLFHAERNECGSNFKVTLKDFNKPKSVCASTCGDGVVASDELCDDGPGGNDSAYGHCGDDCLTRGPYCGDGVEQTADGEACDDGVNLTGYGTGCAPGCQLPARCGDGEVNAVFGEQCDDGVNDGSYGGCTPECQRAAHCGDGTKQTDEACDDGNLLANDGCSPTCEREGLR